MSEQYISVDIETSGPIVGRHSVLSLGACVCDDVSRVFSAELIPISDDVDPAAMAVVGKPLKYYGKSGRPASEVFREFLDWISEAAGSCCPVFVGFNASFDWAFVNWYFLTLLGENPFGIAPLDIKAYYAGFAASSWESTQSSKIPVIFKGTRKHPHDPLEDAIEQAEMFNRIRDAVKQRSENSGRTSDEPKQAALRARLENLSRIGNQQASMHAALRDRYDTANFLLTLCALIPTASLLCLVLVSDDFAKRAMGFSPDQFKLFNAGVALFAFVCVLIQLVWKPDSKSAAHASAVVHFANAKYDARTLLDADGLSPFDVKVIEDKYLDVRGLPPIRDRHFNRLKQRHLRKLDVSKRLDKDPWTRLPRFGSRPKSVGNDNAETR